MKTTVRINFHPAAQPSRVRTPARKHKLPKCETTGLARFRCRDQARDGAKGLRAGSHDCEVTTWACPACAGWHVEKNDVVEPIQLNSTPEPAGKVPAPVDAPAERRYVLWDVENTTHGAKATPDELASFWAQLQNESPRISLNDHVVVGAARSVLRKYRAAIHGSNVNWIAAADVPDGADRALLAAIDLRRVAGDFEGLVIISGDGAFSDLARRAQQVGLTVHVVSVPHPDQRTMLSRELAAATDAQTEVRLEPRRETPSPVTAIVAAPSRTHRRVHFQPIAA